MELKELMADTRGALLDPVRSKLIADSLFKELSKIDCDAVAGLTVAGQIMASRLMRMDPRLNGYLIRYSRKALGLGRLIEGNQAPGKRVVVCDDFVREGGLVFRAIEILEKEGHIVVGVLGLISKDRGLEALQERGYFAYCLFSIEDSHENHEIL
jgi:orotate phosphoribosyltransferase